MIEAQHSIEVWIAHQGNKAPILQIHQFWHDLEVATNDKHQQLIGILNVHLDSLARDVEQVVGAALNLRLEPLDIQLDPPNAQQFHKSIQDLFETGK